MDWRLFRLGRDRYRSAIDGQWNAILAGNDVYGGTFRLFDKVLRRFGLDFDFVDTTDPEFVARALKPTTRMVWLETSDQSAFENHRHSSNFGNHSQTFK